MTNDQCRTLNIVAHPDDDLLFLSPDLLQSIRAGDQVITICLTAADDGAESDYFRRRELGLCAAYAHMSGVANKWSDAGAEMADLAPLALTLTERPRVSLLFMRLPDGNKDGSGFQTHASETLQGLWTGELSTIQAIDGSAAFSKTTLVDALASFVAVLQPDLVRTHEVGGRYGDGDHSDHYTAGYFAQAAVQASSVQPPLVGYEGYNSFFLRPNVTAHDLEAKRMAFAVYAQYDSAVSMSPLSRYSDWLRRQYVAGPRWRRGRWRARMPMRLVLRARSRMRRELTRRWMLTSYC